MVYTPLQFAKKIGFSYEHVLQMCKTKEIESISTEGGHFKIPEKELDKFINKDYITKDEYLRVIRENERLKTLLKHVKAQMEALEV